MNTPTYKPVAKLIERLLFATALAAGTMGVSPAFAQGPAAPVTNGKPQVTPPKNDAALRALTPVPAKMLLNPPDSDWLMWRRTYDAWGFSPLIQLGQASLLVYWVHLEFVYGRVSILPKHSVSIRTASAGLLVIFLAMLVLAFLRTKWKGHGSELLTWFRSPARVQ